MQDRVKSVQMVAECRGQVRCLLHDHALAIRHDALEVTVSVLVGGTAHAAAETVVGSLSRGGHPGGHHARGHAHHAAHGGSPRTGHPAA